MIKSSIFPQGSSSSSRLPPVIKITGEKITEQQFLSWADSVYSTKLISDEYAVDIRKYVNFVFTKNDKQFRDSNTTETEYDITQTMTFLHQAIMDENLPILSFLMEYGANTKIIYSKKTVTSKRSISGGQGIAGAVGSGEWSEQPPISVEKNSVELAGGKQRIIDILASKGKFVTQRLAYINHLIEKKIHERAIEESNIILEDKELRKYHPQAFQAKALIFITPDYSGQDIKKAGDYLTQAQSRIEKDYFSEFEERPDVGKKKREFSNLKMAIKFEQLFPKIKPEKRKREFKEEQDAYNIMNNKLTCFLFYRNHENNFLASVSRNSLEYFEGYESMSKKIISLNQERARWEQMGSLYRDNSGDDEANLGFLKIAESGLLFADTQLNSAKKSQEQQFDLYVSSGIKVIQEREIKRQNSVEKVFFDSKKSKNPYLKKLSKIIFDGRYHPVSAKTEEVLEFEMKNRSSRLLITAEKTIMSLSVDVQHRVVETDEVNALLLTPGNDNPQNKIRDTQETISYGGVNVQYKMICLVKSPNHQGNYYIPGLCDYQRVSEQIKMIIGDDRQKSILLTTMMINLMRDGKPISTDDSSDRLNISSEQVEFLTRLCVNLIKETFRRSTPKEKKHQFPYAAIQARALLLAKEGVIHLTDLFKNHNEEEYRSYDYGEGVFYGAIFGIVTTNPEQPIAAKKNIENVYKKGIFINNFFNRKILLGENSANFFGENRYSAISTRQEIHQELLAVYGGAEDTDDEGYSSEEYYPTWPQ